MSEQMRSREICDVIMKFIGVAQYLGGERSSQAMTAAFSEMLEKAFGDHDDLELSATNLQRFAALASRDCLNRLRKIGVEA